MKINFSAVVLVMLCTGCAVQPISGHIKESELDTVTVNSGEAKFMDAVAVGARIPNTEGIGFIPYVSPMAFVAAAVGGAVGGAIAGGNTGDTQAVMLNAQIATSGKVPDSTTRNFKATDAYAMSLNGLSHPILSPEPPKNGIFATPFMTLRGLEDGLLSHSCAVSFSGFVSGEKKWTLVVNHSSATLPPNTLQNFHTSEFQQASNSCFHLINEAFLKYAKGKYDERFRDGRVTFKSGATGTGTFVRDEELGIALQILKSAYPQAMIVNRFSVIQSLSFD